MELSQQLTSLETSRRLQELGVPQKSIFRYCEYQEMAMTNIEYDSDGDELSAFTFAELGKLLPEFIVNRRDNLYSVIYVITGMNDSSKSVSTQVTRDNLAEALGIIIAYLLENKLITI